MRAVFIEKYGGSDTVQVGEFPTPQPGPHDVLVAIHAASVNPVDFKLREGKLKTLLPHRFPLILGSDLAGTVIEVGKDVTRFKVGDAIYARPNKMRIGTFADYIAVDEQEVALKPKNLSFEEAASVPLIGLTTWQALFERAQLKAGQKILIHAGSGGVGSFAIQLAKHIGATVATTASGRNGDLVKSLGADIFIDYTKEQFEDRLKDFDVVYDTMGGETLFRSFRVLKPGGRIVSIAGPIDLGIAREFKTNPIVTVMIFLMSAKVRKLARRHQVSYCYMFMHPSGEQLSKIAELIEEGKIRTLIDRVFPLNETRAALDYVQQGRTRGKVVIKVK